MLKVFSSVKISAKHFIFLIIFLILAAVANMLLPSFLANMIDLGVTPGNTSEIWWDALFMAIAAAVAFITTVTATKLSVKISTRFAADLRKVIFGAIQGFSSKEVDKFGTASLVARTTTDVTNVQTFFVIMLLVGVLAPIMLVVGIAVIASTGPELCVIIAVAIPVLIVVCLLIAFFSSKLETKLRVKNDHINTLFLESLEGVRVIRAFNKQKHEIKRFGVSNEDYTKTFRSAKRISGCFMPSIYVIFGVTSAAVMAVGAALIYNTDFQVGTLIACSQYVNVILYATIGLARALSLYPTASACAKRMAEVIDTKSSIVDGNKKLENRKLRSTVEFKDVTFSYNSAEKPILKNFNFKANPGEFVAIMGRTGSGKSSVLKLIPRFYDTIYGEVLVDGMNVKDYKVSELRDLIGYVPQKNVLFNGDIASNLNFGNQEGTEKEWEEATKIACADEFVLKKEDKYHSHVSQGGKNFSGGQRQRLAIARAVMKKPEVYLFDDSFSALDMKTDKTLRQNLRETMGDSTVIMVAQRISSVIDADRIIVIDKSEIVGNGTHEELLENCPLYREIAVLQLGEEAVNSAGK